MGRESAAERLQVAAQHLREAVAHLEDLGDEARASYGDTPLDEPALMFAQTWTDGIGRLSAVIDQLAHYAAEAEG